MTPQVQRGVRHRGALPVQRDGVQRRPARSSRTPRLWPPFCLSCVLRFCLFTLVADSFCCPIATLEQENAEMKKSQTKQKQKEAEAQGFGRSITPEQAPVFDPEARFRSNTGGTGPARGTGLAGAGGLDVDASDAIDARALFGLVA